jgi:RNA polymerase primary sigma factor
MAETKRRRRRPAPVEISPSEADRDILDQYFAEVSRYPLLNADEEKALARRVQRGDHDAMEELVRRNLRFVVSVAKKYQNRGLPRIDLIGEGNLGLMTAARKFDPDQGVKFISYAVWWIRQAILASLARQGRTVRVPLNRTADLSRVIRATALLRDKFGREPTPDELSQLTGISPEIVAALSTLNTAEVRLDAAVGKDSDRALIERFAMEELPSTADQVLDRFRNAELERALSTLPPRDARILRLYFGLEGDREHTLDEIGKFLGVTRERVRQLRDRALRRLREGAVGDALRDLSAA